LNEGTYHHVVDGNSRVLVGPYGLHALATVALVLFLTFLGIFNFTTFF
jgi:hypothetical protein